MNDILAKILAVKVEEVAAARQMRSEAEVLREAQARQDVRGFAQAIEDGLARAFEALASGAARAKLEAFCAATRKYAQ